MCVRLLAYLREVLRRDFLDFIRSKRATTSVYPDDERADGQDLSEFTIDQRIASYRNPEDEHLQSEGLVWLVEQFEDSPSTEEVRVD
jgi:DNA-directed RNA polymerase specialized sigma24 family protein